ncbi:MAG: Gx transporter family protein [Clostridium perfringens]|nr:Gx transporter family protein [Clostridium perfringens]
MNTKRLTTMSLLTSMALIIFIIEANLPSLTPIPGIKLGLANIITVYAKFILGPLDTFLILLVRIFLGSIFSGNMSVLLYSLSGGMLCYLSMLILRKFLTPKQIWICSVIGAICHNIGQITVAILITNTFSLIYYLPILMVSAVVSGTFTGLCTQYLINRLNALEYK